MAEASKLIKGRVSALTGRNLGLRLAAIGWKSADFARFCGISHFAIYHYRSGKADGKIPVLIDLALEYAEKNAVEFLTRPEVQTPINHSKTHRQAWLETNGSYPQNAPAT